MAYPKKRNRGLSLRAVGGADARNALARDHVDDPLGDVHRVVCDSLQVRDDEGSEPLLGSGIMRRGHRPGPKPYYGPANRASPWSSGPWSRTRTPSASRSRGRTTPSSIR